MSKRGASINLARHPARAQTFRATPDNLIGSSLLGVFYACVVAFTVDMFFQMPDRWSGTGALRLAFASAFLVGLVDIVSALTARLTIEPGRLTLRTCFRTRSMEIKALTAVERFRTRGSVGLRFRTAGTKMSFSSDTVSRIDIERIEELVHALAEAQGVPLERPQRLPLAEMR